MVWELKCYGEEENGMTMIMVNRVESSYGKWRGHAWGARAQYISDLPFWAAGLVRRVVAGLSLPIFGVSAEV